MKLHTTHYTLHTTHYTLHILTFCCLLFLFFQSSSLIAQVDTIENKSYISQMDLAFAPLLNEPIPFNRLYDRVVPWAGLDYTSSGDTIEFDHFDQAWYELDLCALPTLSSLSASSEEFSDTVSISRLRNIAEVATIATKFSKIDTMAFSDGRLESTEMGWAYVPLQPSPYDTYSITMSATSIEEYILNENYVFRLKSDHVLNSHRSPLISIQITEPSNNINITLLPGQETSLSFIDTGYFHLTLKANFLDASNYTNIQKIKVNRQAETRTACDRTRILVESDIPYKGTGESIGTTSLAEAFIYYHFVGENEECEPVLRKPIIICDGYDPMDGKNKIENIEKIFKFNNGDRYAINDLRNLGFDVIIMNFPVIGEKGTDERSDVRDENNNIVDRKGRDGGSDFTQRNAFLMVKLIQMVNDMLEESNSDEQLCILGPSMGGQLTRYALAYMENEHANGVPDMDHNTRLWISYDSPHHGANIPIGNTSLVATLGYTFNLKTSLKAFHSQINTPAAKQYLINQVDPGGHLQAHIYYQNHSAPERVKYINDLESNGLPGSDGWPQNVRRVAVTNTSDIGQRTGTPGENAFRIVCINALKLIPSVSLNVSSNLQKDYNQWNIPIMQAYFRFFVIYYVPQFLQNKNPVGSIDVIAGSTNNSSEKIFNDILDGLKWNPFFTPTIKHLNKRTHTFIPAISALAFNNPNTDWEQVLNDRDLVCSGEIPFDSYYISGTNDEHITITEGIYDFIEFELLNGIPDCDPICGTYSISGENKICDNNMNTIYSYTLNGTLESGHTLSWNLSGDLSEVSRSGNTIDVRISSPIGSGVIQATIKNECGHSSGVSKLISIGIPIVNLTAQKKGELCFYDVTQNSVPAGITPIKYEWSFNNSYYVVGEKTKNVIMLPKHNGTRTVYGKAYWGCGESFDFITINDPSCEFAHKTNPFEDKTIDNNNAVSEQSHFQENRYSQNNWYVYPNPSSDIWYLKRPESVSNDYNIIVLNLNGEKVGEKIFKKAQSLIQIENKHLTSGLYLLSIRNGEEIVTLKALKH